MTTELEYLSQNLYCLRSELLEPIIRVNGCYKVLLGRVPETVEKHLERIGMISGKLLEEVHAFPKDNIDMQSPVNATEQLRLLAIEWAKSAEDMSILLNKIKTIDVQLEDVGLERILKEIIFNGLQKFQTYIHFIKLTKTEHLTQDGGFSKILNIDMSN